MAATDSANERMVELLLGLTTGEGMRPSILESVRLMRLSQNLYRNPVMYEPSIVIIAQGRKRGYVGDTVYTYDANNYLVLSVPLPFECDTEGTPEHPLLGISIRVDTATLVDLMIKVGGKNQTGADASPQSIYATRLDQKMSDATVRLLESLTSPTDAQILGPQIVREITYRVLCGEQGNSLRAIATLDSRTNLINRALQKMHFEYQKEIDVTGLAAEVGMSNSAFHHSFKEITATSPVQYLKSVRLHKARMLMVQEGVGAGVAASKVGYESPSQFSREFKRLFGLSPLEETNRLRSINGMEVPESQPKLVGAGISSQPHF